MAVALNCTNCSAPLRVDNADVRTQKTTCQFCGTLLHLTDKGSEEYQGDLIKRDPPEGVTVKREEGALSVMTKLTSMNSEGTQVTGTMKPRTVGIFLGISLVICVIVFYVARNTEGACMMSIVAALAAFVAQLVLFTKRNPALILKDGILKTEVFMNQDHMETAVRDIKQLYTVTKNIGNFGSTHDLYALLNNGKRIRLYGSFSNPDIALYIEELMEIEMGMFNLPVFGDAPANQHAESIPQAKITTKLDPCANCGADLKSSDDDHKRGFTTCNFCSTVTLMYAPGAEKPLLGLPDADDPNLQYIIKQDGENLTIHDKNNKVILEIKNGSPVNILNGAKFFMKQVSNDEKVQNAGFMDIVNAARNMEQRMAYSENIDIDIYGSDEEKKRTFWGWFLGNNHFHIVAKTDAGESPVIEDIKNPGEAALLLMTIQQHLN